MSEISATVRLRPTRIAFLVRPNDLASVRKAMRVSTCLWGGSYNPIIPVFKIAPNEWRGEGWRRSKGYDIARGYVRYFEPDVYVEAEQGLLEDIGLGNLREQISFRTHVVTLNDFLSPQDRREWSEPAFGLSVADILRDIYETERRFELRESRPAIMVPRRVATGLTEVVFGLYPFQPDAKYFSENYKSTFKAEELDCSADTWRKVIVSGALTPLKVTRRGLDAQRFWYHDPVIFVFDPARSTDLIDLWNLKIEPRPVIPVPLCWFDELIGDIRAIVRAEYRPVRGNPNGVMHRATVEFARSVSDDCVKTSVLALSGGLPEGALAVKHWRSPIWETAGNAFAHGEGRIEVTAEERNFRLSPTTGDPSWAKFEALAPKFASRFGASEWRWANVVRASTYGFDRQFATVFPHNTFDRTWPTLGRGGDWVAVSREGWVFGQRYKNWAESINLLSHEDAIIGSLQKLGVEAKLSDPGHVARQMLDHLGGLWGAHLLAEVETLQLLNKMAGGVRRKVNATETMEESFERRSAPIKDWNDLIARRKAKRLRPQISIEDFTKRNVIKLGLETDCPNCRATNWHSLTSSDYTLICDRCLKNYDFPQYKLRDHNRNWAYRVFGPFSVPDFGRGSYSAILSLRFLSGFQVSRSEMTFSTAMDLTIEGIKAEADFLAWHRRENHDEHSPPELIIGEAKSFGAGDLISAKDIAKLKLIGRKLSNCFIVVSVLKESFTAREKRLLIDLVNWGRRSNGLGEAANPVILLTAHELFGKNLISSLWKDLGEPHSRFLGYEHTATLRDFADATQQIYLGLPSLTDQRRDEWQKREARRGRGD